MAEKDCMNWVEALSPYKQSLYYLMQEFGQGGWVNAHTHLDRADTNKDIYWRHCGVNYEEASSFSLRTKQTLTGELHRGLAYSPENLQKRIRTMLKKSIAFKVKEIISLIDVADDIGLTALEAALVVKEEMEEMIDFKIGPQPIFGFHSHKKPRRWELYQEAIEKSEVEILGGLPEVDSHPERIGFKEHCYMLIKEAIRLNKQVHIHLDQKNSPNENGTEQFLDVIESIDREIKVKSLGRDSFISTFHGKEPFIWIIHMISPACYNEDRFKTLLKRLKQYNIGVICCPRAAISMLQLRPLEGPIHNSITRVMDLIKAEIPVKFGTDNVADIFIPTGDINMLEEIAILPDIVRYYVKKLWVKIACGVSINNMDLELIGRSLFQDKKAFERL